MGGHWSQIGGISEDRLCRVLTRGEPHLVEQVNKTRLSSCEPALPRFNKLWLDSAQKRCLLHRRRLFARRSFHVHDHADDTTWPLSRLLSRLRLRQTKTSTVFLTLNSPNVFNSYARSVQFHVQFFLGLLC